MNIEIAKMLGADIATATWNTDCYDPINMGFEGKIITLCPHFQK